MSERLWTIRDYALGDEAAIVQLFERVFGKTMGPDESEHHWRWEFAENPVGPQTIKLVWHDDRLVGQYAVSPRRIHVDGQDHLAALSLDTMTDPDYGRQGIFSGSAEACYASMQSRAFEFVYGFPNANSIGGFERRLGWTTIMPTPILVKPIDLGGIVADKARLGALRYLVSPASRMASRVPGLVNRVASGAVRRARGREAVRVFEFGVFDSWADELWVRCRDQHRVWVRRDTSFLRWRYDARPDSAYVKLRAEVAGEAAGYVVLTVAERDQGRVCFVMDLLADLRSPHVATALLRAIEAHAREMNCAFVSAMTGPASPMRALLLRHAYLPLPERFFPQEMYFGARAIRADGRQAIFDPRSWQLGWGDVDVL